MSNRVSPPTRSDGSGSWIETATASALFSDNDIDPDDITLGFHVIDEDETTDDEPDCSPWWEAR